jgi:hypothetical protein
MALCSCIMKSRARGPMGWVPVYVWELRLISLKSETQKEMFLRSWIFIAVCTTEYSENEQKELKKTKNYKLSKCNQITISSSVPCYRPYMLQLIVYAEWVKWNYSCIWLLSNISGLINLWRHTECTHLEEGDYKGKASRNRKTQIIIIRLCVCPSGDVNWEFWCVCV